MILSEIGTICDLTIQEFEKAHNVCISIQHSAFNFDLNIGMCRNHVWRWKTLDVDVISSDTAPQVMKDLLNTMLSESESIEKENTKNDQDI